ncbi:MAG: transposase [Mycobacterium sp.]|nr:transposase [Mycobacterium sp.]
MCKSRLFPSVEQAAALAEHCRHARFVWNLAVEQQRHWQLGRQTPGYNEQCAQLTAARAGFEWLVVPAAYTSQRCSRCGHAALENRKSRAVFECVACSAGPCNADVNAARNIAAGRAVTARGDLGPSRSVNREPQLCSPGA